MLEQNNQRISQFLDDELNEEESLAVLEQMRKDSELMQKMLRYEMISQAIRSEPLVPLNTDFSKRIADAVKSEPAHLLQHIKKSEKRTVFTFPVWATAASLTLFAVVLMNKVQQTSDIKSIPVALYNQQEDPSLDVMRIANSSPKEPEQSQSKFVQYLQAHNSGRYVNGASSTIPYAKLANISR